MRKKIQIPSGDKRTNASTNLESSLPITIIIVIVLSLILHLAARGGKKSLFEVDINNIHTRYSVAIHIIDEINETQNNDGNPLDGRDFYGHVFVTII